MKAFENLKQIIKLKTPKDQHRAWLQDYEGLHFSIAENKYDCVKWKEDKEKYVYSDKRFSEPIECIDKKYRAEPNKIQRLKSRLVIEEESENFEENYKIIEDKLMKEGYGYIKSSHNGKRPYLWVEFTRDLTTAEAKRFLQWIAEECNDPIMDMNFSSDNFRFPVLFATHWKYPKERELPIYFQEGNKIDFDKLDIPKKVKPTKTVMKDGEEYEVSYNKSQLGEAQNNFEDLNLLEKITEELNKTHLEDDNLKLLGFLVGVSGLSNNPKKRMSLALTGDSSVGKDNLIQTIFKHMPNGKTLFLTSGTQASIEDYARKINILGLSEMNLFREFGANKNLLEIVKQKTEGGTSALKKDAKTQFATSKLEEGEQGTVFYGTTEAERDIETETRFIFGHVTADYKKILRVNKTTADKIADLDKLIFQNKGKDSWVKIGLADIMKKFGDYVVWIPHARLLMEKIEDKDIFDHNSPRSMRDIKRLFALIEAMTRIFAHQRKKCKYKNTNILISEPEDIVNTIKISKEFFDQTYEGMDERLDKVLNKLTYNGWTARDDIQRDMKVTINTIKEYCRQLESHGLIKWISGKDLNNLEEIKSHAGNKIYLQRCHQAIKKALIRCEIEEIEAMLKVSIIDTQKLLEKEVLKTIK